MITPCICYWNTLIKYYRFYVEKRSLRVSPRGAGVYHISVITANFTRHEDFPDWIWNLGVSLTEEWRRSEIVRGGATEPTSKIERNRPGVQVSIDVTVRGVNGRELLRSKIRRTSSELIALLSEKYAEIKNVQRSPVAESNQHKEWWEF